jgi:hypothetical protein
MSRITHTATSAEASVAMSSQGVKLLVSSSKTKMEPPIGALKATASPAPAPGNGGIAGAGVEHIGKERIIPDIVVDALIPRIERTGSGIVVDIGSRPAGAILAGAGSADSATNGHAESFWLRRRKLPRHAGPRCPRVRGPFPGRALCAPGRRRSATINRLLPKRRPAHHDHQSRENARE